MGEQDVFIMGFNEGYKRGREEALEEFKEKLVRQVREDKKMKWITSTDDIEALIYSMLEKEEG